MKNTKKIKALLLAVMMLLSVMLLAACGTNGDSTTQGGSNATYQVTVVDGTGSPYTSGIIVRFLQNGEQVAMEKVNENGVAEKTLPKGEYTVELMFTDSNAAYYYDQNNVTLTAENPQLQIVLIYTTGGEARTLSVGNKEYQAYAVNTGSTYVKLNAGERNYFLFSPTVAGTYQFSVQGEGIQLGYYGAPHFVQENSAAEVKDNTFTSSVSSGMIGTGDTGTTVMVIGIDSSTAAEAILSIQRIGDPEWTVSDEPWTEYKLKSEIKPFTLKLEAGQKLTYVDITASTDTYQIVYSESDGNYHLGTADGPVIYINLGKNAPNASLQVIIMGDGAAGGAPIRKYFYDASGEFVKKEDYTEILMDYFDCMDETYGVYPLNDDLIYIIQNGCSGWWDTSSPNFIFDGCNPELGWLFACCYIEG